MQELESQLVSQYIYIHTHIYIHIYIYIYTYIYEKYIFGKSDKMTKIGGKVDKSNTYNRLRSNILFEILLLNAF